MLSNYNSYLKEASEVSKDKDGNALVNSNFKLYDLDHIARSECLNCYKTADAIHIKNNDLFLIEFKGGDEILNYNIANLKKEKKRAVTTIKKYEIANKIYKKKEMQANLKLKINETLLFVLPEVFPKTLSEILDEFKIWYIIIVSDKININVSINPLRNRLASLSSYSKPTQLDMKKYNGVPLHKVITETSTYFDRTIVNYL